MPEEGTGEVHPGGKRRLEKAKKRLADIDKLITRIYEDMVLGNLRRERYQKMLEGYEAEQAALNNEVIGLEDWVATSEEMEDNVDQFLALLEKYVDIPELTPPSAADSYLSLLSLRFLVFFVHAAGGNTAA